jgi:hypothetical protein
MTCQNCIDECKICMEPIPSDLFQFLPCTDKLCKFCFQTMTKMECPFCRYDFSNEISEEDEPDFFRIIYRKNLIHVVKERKGKNVKTVI